MSGLFVELYLDEDVDVALAELVRARGFDVTTTQEAGQSRKTDPEQLAYAAAHEKTLFTHNRNDFEGLVRLYFDTGQMHWGVIIAVRRPSHVLARRLLGKWDLNCEIVISNPGLCDLPRQTRILFARKRAATSDIRRKSRDEVRLAFSANLLALGAFDAKVMPIHYQRHSSAKAIGRNCAPEFQLMGAC